MRNSRWAAAHGKRDANEAPIVEALRTAGATVVLQQNSGRAKGTPDLLVGYGPLGGTPRTFLLEVKMPGEFLNAAQVEWWRAWRGEYPHLVRSVTEALGAVGVPGFEHHYPPRVELPLRVPSPASARPAKRSLVVLVRSRRKCS